MPLFEIKNLVKEYENESVKTTALTEIDFSIEAGEFVAIMGPSGSGKSTLLQILGFLDRQTAGICRWKGKTIEEMSGDDVAKIRNADMGFVFQAFNLLPRTSVLENVKLPLLYSKVPEHEWNDRAEKAIASVGLSHRIHHEPSQLSGGEKQRVAIARALVNNPTVIFADEPTGNLDSKSGKVVMEILEDLNERQGHTIILITHESYTALHAKRIIKIYDGKIVSDEKVDPEMRKKANSNFVK